MCDIWEGESFCEREYVCAIMPVAPRATCAGPGEIESELEAINLTFRCYQIWFGAEYSIYSIHTLCFSLHSLLLLSLSLSLSLSISPSCLSFYAIHRYWFRSGEQHSYISTFEIIAIIPITHAALIIPPLCE